MLHASQSRRRPREARFRKIWLFFWGGFVFRIPIAKSRIELSEGPVSEFENRPVSASLRDGRQQIPHSPSLQSAPSGKILAMRSFADFFCPKEEKLNECR